MQILADHLTKRATSVLDVGSAGCPYLDWFPHVPHRTSVDLKVPYVADTVASVKSDFLTWAPDRHYDVVICLQVLEHVPDAAAFAQKLLKSGKVVIVSVPYKWEKGRTKSHIHDPVTMRKMRKWFGRAPSYEYIVSELAVSGRRLIQVYDDLPAWRSLGHRDQLLKAKAKRSDRELVNSSLRIYDKWLRRAARLYRSIWREISRSHTAKSTQRQPSPKKSQ